MILQLAADAAEAAPGTSAWERALIALIPVLLAIIALFEPKVRKRVAGTSEPATPSSPENPAAVAKTVAQTVADGSGLQHMLVKDLQRRLDAAEVRSEKLAAEADARAEKLAADIDKLQDQVADLRVTIVTRDATIATLEERIARMRAGWDRP